MTEEEFLQQQTAALRQSDSPGTRARAQAEQEMANEQRKVSDQAAEQKYRESPIKPNIDYKGAFAAGDDFTTGVVGNQFVPYEGGPGLFGHDPQTGGVATSRFNKPEYAGPVETLSKSRSNPLEGIKTANLDDTLPLAQLAHAGIADGMDSAEFSKNVPPQWDAEMTGSAWDAASNLSATTAVQPKLERLNAQPPVPNGPAEYTTDEFKADAGVVNASKVLYKHWTGEDFTGSDAEAGEWMVDHQRWFDMNVVTQSKTIYALSRATPEVTAAYGEVFDKWDKTEAEMTLSNLAGNVGRAALDPTNLIGLGYGKVAATTATRMALKAIIKNAGAKAATTAMKAQAVKAGVKEVGKDLGKLAATGAVAGAIGEVHHEVAKGLATERGVEGEDLAKAGATGAAMGAGSSLLFNEGFAVGGRMISNAYRKAMGKPDAPLDMETVVGQILVDRANGVPRTDTSSTWGEINNILDETLAPGNPTNVVYDQLINAGRSVEESTANAQVVGAWYTTMAKQYDVTPEELFRTLPLHTQMGGGAGPRVLNQAPPAITKGDRPGALNVTGVHFSRAQRDILSGEHYGTGMRGAESRNIDPNMPRLFFYADEGKGIRAETGVGGVGHEVDLKNIYDLETDPLRIQSKYPDPSQQAARDAEIIARGFNGYYARGAMPADAHGGRQGVVVALGDTTRNMPTRPYSGVRAGMADAPKPREAAAAFRSFADDYSLPAMATPKRYGEVLAKKNPELHAKLAPTGIFDGADVPVRRSDLYDAATDPEAFAPHAKSADFEDFTPKNVKNILNRDNWAVLTAADPGATPLPPAENAARNAQLMADLDAMGVQYKEITGKYGDVQPGVLVTGITPDQARQLGDKYGQESVLTNKGLEYMDGRVTPTTGKVETFDTPPDDFYTTIRNDDGTETYFSVGLDFDKTGTVFNQDERVTALADELSLERSFELADQNSFATNRELKVAMDRNARKLAKAAGVDLKKFNKKTRSFLGTVGLRDVETSLRENPDAVGWYDATTRKAMDIMSLVHPELETDPAARMAFTWALATTSNGVEVSKNFELAEQAYRVFKETGAMPTNIGIGNARGSINKTLGLYNDLRARWGDENLAEFLASDLTVSEIKKLTGLKVNGELAGTAVRGAAIMGPKIGNGFFSNLNGYFDALTMDRWLLRSWGRWTGSLINERPDQVKAKTDELRSVVAELRADPEATKAIEAVLGQKITSRNMGALAEAVLKASQKPENRDVMNATPAGEKLRLVGNALAKWADGQKEAPANGNERNQIRAVFGDMLKEMQKSNPDMTMADMQALLWYSERRLYDKAKAKEDVSAGYEPDEAPDYANAAASLAESLGIDPAAINAIKGADYGTNRAGGAGRAAGAGDSQAGSEGGAGSGSVLNQGPKGTYNPGTQVVTLFETADQSTFAHESAHHFLEMTSLMAQSPGAPSGLVRDLKKTLKWMGTNPKEWASMTMEQKRNMHEKYARGFEGYLRDGVAPTKSLENSFAAFKGWLTKIYQSADALGAPINDEVRGVFDRMLGGGASVGPVSAAMRGALPVLGGGEQQGVYNQFAGPASVMSPINRVALYRAQKSLDAGADAEQVRVDTGWFMGKDGKMRYEISDKNAVPKEMNMPAILQVPRNDLRKQAARDVLGDGWEAMDRSAPDIREAITNRWDELASAQDAALQEWANRPLSLSDVLDHPELFRAYPGMANMKVEMVPMDRLSLGSYNLETDTITLNGQPTQRKLLKEQVSTLLHEVQHAIQQREGFARGGNPQSMKWDDYSPAFKAKIEGAREKAREYHAAGKEYARDLALNEAQQLVQKAQFEAYQRLLGEVEARDTQWRASMDDMDRRIMTPDQGKDDVIIRWNNQEFAASFHQDPTPEQIRSLDDAAKAILGEDTGKLLRDALDADEMEMPGKYINTGTINTERLHPGAAMAKDPGRFVGQIENAEDLAKLMNYIGEGLQLSEPPRTHGEVARTATLMELEPLLRGEQTGLASDRQLYAMRSLVATLGDQTVALSKKITAGDHSPETLLNYEKTGQQLIAMQKLLTGNVREVARALSQQRMIATVLSADDIKALERSMNEATSPGALINNANALTKQLENGVDPVEALAKSLKRRTWLEAGVEFWTANILTNPTTHAVNMVSGLALDAWHIGVVKPLAGAIGSTRGLADMGAAERITLSEAAASISAGTRAIADGMRGMFDVLMTNQSQFDKIGRGDAKTETMGALGTKLGETFGRKGEVAAEVLTPAFRLLRAEDELFKTIAFRSEIAGLATRSGIMAGLEGDALKAHADAFLKNPPEEAYKAALQKADELTLQDTQMGGGVIGIIGMEARKLTSRFPALKFIMPFITTPVNAVVTGIESSVFAVVSPKLRRDILAGGAASDMAIAKIVSGTALTGFAYLLYQQGMLTGAGPENPDQKKMLMASGWRPNSIRIGDTYTDINRLDPFGAALASAAGAMDRATFERREIDMVREMGGAISAFAERMLDLPFLQGVKDLMDSFEYGLSSAPYMTAKIAGGFVPMSGLMGGVARLGDQETGVKVPSRPSELGLGGMGTVQDMVYIASQQLKSRMPWLRDGLRPARYWDGEIVMPDQGSAAAFTSPLRTASPKRDRLTDELVKNGIGYAEAPPAITVAGVTLSVLEFDKLQGKAYDRMLERIGTARRELVSEVVNSSEYESLPAGPGSDRAAALTRAMPRGRRAGEMQFLTEDLPAMIRSGEIDPNEIARQVGADPETFFKAALADELAPQPGNRMKIRGGAAARPITPSGSGQPRI